MPYLMLMDLQDFMWVILTPFREWMPWKWCMGGGSSLTLMVGGSMSVLFVEIRHQIVMEAPLVGTTAPTAVQRWMEVLTMYESPIQLYMTDIQTQLVKRQEEHILKAVQSVAVGVDHDELFRALKYDREQYEKGYADARASIVRCKDCKHNEDCIRRIQLWGRNSVLELNTIEYHPIDFCSYGERKDNDENG
jgi:hypothetical protein